MINLNNQNVYIGKRLLLKDVNLSINTGEIIQFSGPNGSGKTTLIEYIIKEIPSLKYSYLPQIEQVAPKMYLELKDICNTEAEFYPKELFNKSWHEVSGGERKKALIARTLLTDAELYILDEPFNHLDAISTNQVKETIERRVKENKTIIYIDHKNELPNSIRVEVQKWRY